MQATKLLLHPCFLAALTLLILNDRVFKPAWPGAITGKLSDFAGLFVLPVFLCATWTLLRLRLSRVVILGAILLSDLIFIAVKTWPAASEFYVAALSALGIYARVVRDPTDLIALVMSVPVYFFLNSDE